MNLFAGYNDQSNKEFPAISVELGYEYLLVAEKTTWQGARQGCFGRGYHLAWIESQEETAFINHNITSKSGN